MIRTIDKHITGLYQALVNASGKKPMWWGEHCAYLAGLLVVARYGMELNMEPVTWKDHVLAIFGLFIAGAMLCISRVEILWDLFTRRAGGFFRGAYIAATIFNIVLAGYEPGIYKGLLVAAGIVMTSYFYFGQCQDPPPPKPRTKTKLAGNH